MPGGCEVMVPPSGHPRQGGTARGGLGGLGTSPSPRLDLSALRDARQPWRDLLRRAEGEGDGDGSEPDPERADIEPEITAVGVEQPPARPRTHVDPMIRAPKYSRTRIA